MQGIVKEARAALTWFTQEQRDHFALVLSYEDEDASMVHGLMRSMEQADASALYLVFAHEARTARAYVDVLLELLHSRFEAINAERGALGVEPIPNCPAECYDSGVAPSERLKLIMRWWRTGLGDGQRVVLGLLPTKLPDVDAYRELVWGLLPFGDLEPWTRFTRLVVRDRRLDAFIEPHLPDTDSIATAGYTVDFSPSACQEGLTADAANPALPERDRGVAMLQLAALDQAHRRYDLALNKYGVLANLFVEMGEEGLVALCLCGAGDVHVQMGDLLEARKRYVQGVEAATKAKAKPALLNCLIGLGQTTAALGEHRQSETWWDTAARVSGSMGNPYGVVDAVEQLGVARKSQMRPQKAWVAWEQALELIQEHPYPHREVTIRERMIECARENHWTARQQEQAPLLAIARAAVDSSGEP